MRINKIQILLNIKERLSKKIERLTKDLAIVEEELSYTQKDLAIVEEELSYTQEVKEIENNFHNRLLE